MLSLLDGDLIIYPVGYTTENDDLNTAYKRCDAHILNILYRTNALTYRIFISDSAGNFRKVLYPEYKANRTKPKPTHYLSLTNYLIDKWNAEITWEQEADDALGIVQDKEYGTTILCSFDKDLNQIPGYHYNSRKDIKYYVMPLSGLRLFYDQLLTGDPGDNIPGLKGINEMRKPRREARDKIKLAKDEKEMFSIVKQAYQIAGLTDDDLLLRGRLLKIRTTPNELWEPPIETG